MPSTFGVSPGQNSVVAKVSLTKDGTPLNGNAIADFIDGYAMGQIQDMILHGPVNHPCKMLNGFLNYLDSCEDILAQFRSSDLLRHCTIS